MQPRQSRFTPIAMLVLTVCVVLVFTTATLRTRQGAPRSTFYNELVGRPATPFTLKDLNGQEVSLASMEGRVIVLDFWATYCPSCVESLPKLTALTAKYADQGVVFHAINVGDSPAEVQAFLSEHKMAVPVLLDEQMHVGMAYQSWYFPLTVVIGRDGRILAHANLAPEEADETLTRWIESAVKSGQAS